MSDAFAYFQIKTIIFDKTGTITHGTPRVVKTETFVPATDLSENEFFAISGTAEASSEHPLGIAVVKHAKEVSTLFSDLYCVYLRHAKELSSLVIDLHSVCIWHVVFSSILSVN